MKALIVTLFFAISLTFSAQTKHNPELPYYQIPEAPEAYNAGTVVSRMIDGLGFRYYWATEGLTEKDLDYKPGNEARTAGETMDHVLGLSRVIVNSARKVPNDRTQAQNYDLTFDEKRAETLQNFKESSHIFKLVDDLSSFMIVFKNDKGSNEFPFWNNINGTIEDAIWHAGQIVVLRRIAGNPINSKANVFLGKKTN